MTERITDTDAKLQVAAKRMIIKGGTVSRQDIDAYLRLASELPLPDFSSRSEQERANNTDRYKRARSVIRRKLGIKVEKEE